MTYDKTIRIDTLLPTTADRKAKAIQDIVNVLDEDNLEMMANLCRDKKFVINQSLRANAELIKNNL